MATFTSSTFLGGAGRFKLGGRGSWTLARDAAASLEDYATYEVESQSDGSANSWSNQRVFLPIDTSSIPTNATVTSVTLNFTGNYEGGFSSTEIHLIQTTQGTTGSRVAADYNNVAFVSGGSEAINNAGATSESITGNATALTWITLGGTTKLALITTADLNDTDPNGGTDHWCTVTSPELVVEYTVPTTATGSYFHFM